VDLEAGNPTQKAATDFGGGTGNTGPIRYRIAVRSEGRRWAAHQISRRRCGRVDRRQHRDARRDRKRRNRSDRQPL